VQGGPVQPSLSSWMNDNGHGPASGDAAVCMRVIAKPSKPWRYDIGNMWPTSLPKQSLLLSHRPIVFADSIIDRMIGLSHYSPNPKNYILLSTSYHIIPSNTTVDIFPKKLREVCKMLSGFVDNIPCCLEIATSHAVINHRPRRHAIDCPILGKNKNS